MTKPKTPSSYEGLVNILFSVILPITILHRMTSKIGPVGALILALAMPVGYSAFEYMRFRKKNFLGVLGILNVSITGGLALFSPGNHWFPLKEAAFPALVGAFVILSAYVGPKKPFIETIVLNPALMKLDMILEKIALASRTKELRTLVLNCNLILALSFFATAAVNYWISLQVFLPIDSALSVEKQAGVLNEQIAAMTSKAFLIVAIPSFIVLGTLLTYFLQRLAKMIDLKVDDLMVSG